MDKLWNVGGVAIVASVVAGVIALDMQKAGAIGFAIGVAGAAVTTGLIVLAHAITTTSRKD